jgi:hypothetical protein
MGDGRQPLDVRTEQSSERLGLGLAQLRKLLGDVCHRAVVLAQLLAGSGWRGLHRRGIAVG